MSPIVVDRDRADLVEIETKLRLQARAQKRIETPTPTLRAYIADAWHVVEPSTPFVPGWHLDAIAEHLEAVTRGQIRNLLINMPPRSMKSLAVSVFWPTWEWASNPERRFLFASYAASLSIRDSLKCRRIIESPWYQRSWGHVYQLTSDQNVKSRYENDKTGYRIATSVGGSATGEGGDRVVCLEGNTLIATSHGDIPIAQIVEERLPVRVLGPSGRWQAIRAYERNSGKSLLEIETESEQILRCTEDHLIYIRGLSWKPARDVLEYAYGDVSLYGLRERVRPSSSACSAGKNGTILFSCLFRGIREEQEQPILDGWHGGMAVPRLRDGATDKAGRSQEAAILFSQMWSGSQNTPAAKAMPQVWGNFSAKIEHCQILQSNLCQSISSWCDTRRSERELQARRMDDRIYAGISPQSSTADQAARREYLCSLRENRYSAGPSYRRLDNESRSYEFSDSLHIMPSESSHEKGLDGPIRVRIVRRLGTPAFVYNLRVAPDQAYYANGILVHNCDDPHAVQEGESDPIREGVLSWWDEVMSTRLNDPKTGAKVIVMQRIHQNDLSGHVLEQGGYEHLCLPAQYEGARYYTSIGWTDPRTVHGELLWPERFGLPEIVALQRSLGSYAASGQLQQRPSPAEGGMLKRGWWRFYRQAPTDFDEVILSWDMAFKDLKTSDYVCGQTWGRRGADKYLLDQVHDRLDFPATVQAVRTLSAKWPQAYAKLVEDKANGTAVLQTLAHEIAGLIAVEPQGGKVARVAAVSPQIEAGNVYLPEPAVAPWVHDFIEECAAFPNAAHDDMCDAMSQALLRFAAATLPFGWLTLPLGAANA